MIFLLNRERVLLEVIELARLKIATLLNVPAQAGGRTHGAEGRHGLPGLRGIA
jgi:hypothetical protein